ncbi:hypothetical protein F4604DRAFT_755357 [Suillus subluteus]|nr:hypothetical protein F4604DRAFT_755357 [Suillus subluteus]
MVILVNLVLSIASIALAISFGVVFRSSVATPIVHRKCNNRSIQKIMVLSSTFRPEATQPEHVQPIILFFLFRLYLSRFGVYLGIPHS